MKNARQPYGFPERNGTQNALSSGAYSINFSLFKTSCKNNANQINRFMRRLIISIFLVSLVVPGFADDLITREYLLKNADAPNIIPVVNFLVVNPTGKRIMGGQGKKLV